MGCFLGPLRVLKEGQKHYHLLNVLTFQDSEVAMSFGKTLQLDAILSPNVKFHPIGMLGPEKSKKHRETTHSEFEFE